MANLKSNKERKKIEKILEDQKATDYKMSQMEQR